MAEKLDGYVLKLFEPEDYEVLKSWWKEAPPKSSLPKIGFVIGDYRLIGFLAQTDTDFTIMTWWHCNPENKAKESHESIRRYAMVCIEMTKQMGCLNTFMYSQKRGIIKVLESLGFTNHDGHLVHKQGG